MKHGKENAEEKKRAKKYEPKLKIHGNFIDVIKAAVAPEEKKKPAKKK